MLLLSKYTSFPVHHENHIKKNVWIATPYVCRELYCLLYFPYFPLNYLWLFRPSGIVINGPILNKYGNQTILNYRLSIWLMARQTRYYQLRAVVLVLLLLSWTHTPRWRTTTRRFTGGYVPDRSRSEPCCLPDHCSCAEASYVWVWAWQWHQSSHITLRK